MTGFLGPNGAGKSTTMRIMVGLTRATSGTVTISGRHYVDLPNPGREVGVLLDASAQHAGRTGREILTIAQQYMGLPRHRVEEMLEVVSLTPAEASRRVGNYSLGMRQRLGIATALIGDPGVLILDEPANGLDPAGIRWMRDLLRGYADRGGTVLLSSHLLHEIEVIADDIVMIGNGRIVSQGTKTELLHAAGTVVRAADLDRLRRALGELAIARPVRRRRPAHRRGPGPGRQGGAGGRRRPHRAQSRRRRARGHVPGTHRHLPARRSNDMTAIAVENARPSGSGPASGAPDARDTGRAPQDVRHPLGLLADRQHRHLRRPGHRGCDPVGAGRPAHLLHLRDRHPVPGGDHPAADRDPRGHQRMEPTHRTHDVHPGPAPQPDHHRQGHLSSVLIAVAAMVLTFAVGALGNLLSAAVTGTALVWDVTLTQCLYYVLGMILSLLTGFMLGVLIRSSTGAIVAYFVLTFVLPTIFGLLAESQRWFHDLQPWIDIQFAQSGLFIFDQALTGEQWANIAVTGITWLLVPLAIGLGFVMRAEVK